MDMAPGHLVETLSEGAEAAREEVVKTSRRARKRLERKAKQTRKDLARGAGKARRAAEKEFETVRRSAAHKVEEFKPTRKERKAAVKEAKESARAAKHAVTDLKMSRKEAKKARKEAERAIDASTGRKRRRKWPLVVGLGLVAAGAAYAMRPKAEPPLSLVPPPADPPRPVKPTATSEEPVATQTSDAQPKHAMDDSAAAEAVTERNAKGQAPPTPKPPPTAAGNARQTPAQRSATQDKQQTGAEKRA
ncbi:MAG: hypothetical protein ACRDQ7_20160 [Haloechinothrix sp.]